MGTQLLLSLLPNTRPLQAPCAARSNCKFVGVVRVGLRFSACVVDGSARD